MKTLIQKQKDYYNSGKTKSWAFRRSQLLKLKNLLLNSQEELIEAVKKDLRKSEFEILSSELMILLGEINIFLKKGSQWGKTKKVNRSLTTLDGQGEIQYHPYGVVLIISPWNYPIQLALLPLIGAIGTGNCAIIKPSEITPHCSAYITKLINSHFDESYLKVIEGEVSITQELLSLDFDKIFFTGSPQIGKIIMEKAAQHLTPVTLELGGKSPVIIDRLSQEDLKKGLKRIIWGKFLNSGQTCIAPDYILIHQNDLDILQNILPEVMQEYLNERITNPIINQKHYDRLKSYLSQGQIIFGGKTDDNLLNIELTFIKTDDLNIPLMKDEIFGPIMPIVLYQNKEEALQITRTICSHPLAIYIFTKNKAFENYFLNNISFGGASVNDTISQILIHDLPFGGVRSSGMGSYHGQASFECFSRQSSIFRKGFNWELPFRYPPYNKSIKILKIILKTLSR